MEIRTERPKSRHPKMDISNRAKQFAPFAALGRLDAAFSEIEGASKAGELEHAAIFTDLSAEEIADMTQETDF